MKLKTLVLVVGLLAAVALVVFILRRPAPPPATDARVGQALVPAESISSAARLRLVDGGQTVELTRDGSATWRVTSFHDLPADFGKLSRFVRDLADARVERLVTRTPELIGRLQFGETSIELAGPEGRVVWSAELGRNADGGGRFIRFADEPAAYLTRMSAWIDPTSRNWVDSRLSTLKPEDIARIELSWPDSSEVITSVRASATAPFTPEDADAQPLRQAPLTSLLTSLTQLRFSAAETSPAIEGETETRTARLTTFGGQTVAFRLERVTPPPAPAPDADESGLVPPPTPSATATVYATVDGPVELAPLVAAPEGLRFTVSEFSFSSWPAAASALREPAAIAEAPEDLPPEPGPEATN